MWVSEKEKTEAKQYDAFSYLRVADPGELVKLSRNEYCLRSHDSFKLSQKNGTWLWYWYSRDFGGRTAVDYLIKVKGYHFVDAIKEVNQVMKGTNPSFFIGEESKRRQFKLLRRSCRHTDAIDYLCSRGIDKELVEELIEAKMIYQSDVNLSVVFVGFDDKGKPAHGAYRIITEGATGKGDCVGSNKSYAFRIETETADTVRVFESAIDLLSYITLCKLCGKEYEHESLISTAGISAKKNTEGIKVPLALNRYLKAHPNTETILLHFDNDKTGRKCAEQLKQKLSNEYRVKIVLPKEGKDYNEYLQIVRSFDNEGVFI